MKKPQKQSQWQRLTPLPAALFCSISMILLVGTLMYQINQDYNKIASLQGQVNQWQLRKYMLDPEVGICMKINDDPWDCQPYEY